MKLKAGDVGLHHTYCCCQTCILTEHTRIRHRPCETALELRNRRTRSDQTRRTAQTTFTHQFTVAEVATFLQTNIVKVVNNS